MQIKIEVSGNIAVVTDKPEVITTGTRGLPVLFTFDQSWEGLQKTAVFRCGNISRVKTGIDTATTVPPDVLKKPNTQLSIGVYGVNADGTIAIPTVWANVDNVKPGADPEAEPATDPALPVYQQLLNDTKDLRESLEWLEADTANELADLKTSVADLRGDVNTLDKNTRVNFASLSDEINNLSDRVDKIELSGGGGGGGIAPLIVTFDDQDDRRVTHTASQIHEHAEAGGAVWFDDSGDHIALTQHTEEVAHFSTINTSGSIMVYRVYDNGTYENLEDTLASADDVFAVVGDIDSALDELHAYAQALIGGDS